MYINVYVYRNSILSKYELFIISSRNICHYHLKYRVLVHPKM